MDHQDCGGKKYKQICTCGGGWCAVHCSENRVRSWFVGENCHHIWSPPPVQETGQIKKPKMIHNKYWSNILPHLRTSGKGLSTGKDDAPTLNDLEEDDDGKKLIIHWGGLDFAIEHTSRWTRMAGAHDLSRRLSSQGHGSSSCLFLLWMGVMAGDWGVLCNVVDIERGHLHRQCPRCRGYSDILSMFIYSYPTIYSFNHHQHHYASLQCANAPSVAAQWQGWNSKQILSSPFKRNLQKRII